MAGSYLTYFLVLFSSFMYPDLCKFVKNEKFNPIQWQPGPKVCMTFYGTKFFKTNFFGANFLGTKFFVTNFFGTNFSGANFLGTEFFGANFIGTILFEKKFFGTIFFWTNFFWTKFFGTVAIYEPDLTHEASSSICFFLDFLKVVFFLLQGGGKIQSEI